jgi:hypothetical protein
MIGMKNASEYTLDAQMKYCSALASVNGHAFQPVSMNLLDPQLPIHQIDQALFEGDMLILSATMLVGNPGKGNLFLTTA